MIKLVSDTIDKKDIKALTEWLNQDEIPRLTKGELTKELEEKWAKKLGTNYSVFVNSGSSSIFLTLAALKQQGKLKNNKIVVPALSWATDLSSPMLLDFDITLCDCNLQDLSCDLEHLEKIFKEQNPSILILVSVLGLVPDMKRVVDLCKKYNVLLLEDVCESMGSEFNNQSLGTFGYASFFSMYFGHHLSTIEGGFINTDDEEFYYLLLMMRSHGWDRDLPEWKQEELREKHNVDDFNALYNFYVPGMNLRATDLQAFIGLRALDKLDSYSTTRSILFSYYLDNINNNLHHRYRKGDFISNFAFPILKENRKEIIQNLIDNNIEVRPLIAGNLARKTMWGGDTTNLPNADLVNKNGFYVPNHQGLSMEDVDKIIKIINS